MGHHQLSGADLNSLRSLLSSGASVTITPPQPPTRPQRVELPGWKTRWVLLLCRMQERAWLPVCEALSAKATAARTRAREAEEERDFLREQNDALSLRMQLLIQDGRRFDLRHSQRDPAPAALEPMEHGGRARAGEPDDQEKNSALQCWLQLLGVRVSVVAHGAGDAGFPFRFIVYDTKAEAPSQRIIKIDCSIHGDPREAEVENTVDWCQIAIPVDTSFERRFLKKEFCFKEPSLGFEFKEDQMQVDGTTMVLVFDVYPVAKRVARFPKHNGDIKVPQGDACASSSSWADVQEMYFGNDVTAESNDQTSDADSLDACWPE